MPVVSGRSSPARALSTIEFVGPLSATRLTFLLALGALTIVLHQKFHYPLKMPGHHGLEAMALLVLGRLSCTNPFSATIVGASTAMTALMTGAEHDLSSALLNMAPGVMLDLALMTIPNWRSRLYVVPFAVAFAHAAKPILRLVLAQSFDMHFGSLRSGLLFPLSTHMAYGFAGGLIAILLWRAAVKQRAADKER